MGGVVDNFVCDGCKQQVPREQIGKWGADCKPLCYRCTHGKQPARTRARRGFYARFKRVEVR